MCLSLPVALTFFAALLLAVALQGTGARDSLAVWTPSEPSLNSPKNIRDPWRLRSFETACPNDFFGFRQQEGNLKEADVTATAAARLDLLDSLRGFALMGLFLFHSVELYELFWLKNDYGAVFTWSAGLFSGKSYALMSLCFGVSFFLIMQGAARRGQDYRGRFAWRLTILLGIGLLHGLVYRGDILQVIAVLGFAMLLLDRIRSNRTLLVLAGVCFLQLPLLLRAWAASQGFSWGLTPPLYFADQSLLVLANGALLEAVRAGATEGFVAKWSYFIEAGRVVQMLGLFMVGLVLGRIGFFAEPGRFRKARRLLLLVSLVVAPILYFQAYGLLDAAVADGPVRQNLRSLLDNWTGLAIATVQLLLFVELYETAARPLLRVFAAPGRMTLTLYVGQSIVFVPIYYGFGLGLYDDLDAARSLTIGIAAFAIQTIVAHVWFRHFHYGPLEWVWRAATRTSLEVPFVKVPAVAAARD
ncbi:MAG TPA: DUF418 domain-containing protein [Brevundimonas sp.]|nr:DUF418 domain-containing protein [Brevundimonas sp.]